MALYRHIAVNGLRFRSESGVVNIYSLPVAMASATPKPVRVVNNLLTSCTSARFNTSGELVALGSQFTDKSVKLVSIRVNAL